MCIRDSPKAGPVDQGALDKLKSDQTSYGEDLSGSENRDSLFERGDPRVEKLFAFFDNIMSLTTNLGIDNGNEKYFSSARRVIRDVELLAKEKPKNFKISKEEFESLKRIDVSRIGFPLLLRHMVHKRSRNTGLLVGGISALLGPKIQQILERMRHFSWLITVSLGVEPVLMTYNIYPVSYTHLTLPTKA